MDSWNDFALRKGHQGTGYNTVASTDRRTNLNLRNIYLIGLFSTNAQQPIAAHTDDDIFDTFGDNFSGSFNQRFMCIQRTP